MIINYNRRENTGDVLFFFHIHPTDNSSHRGCPPVCKVELSDLEGNHYKCPSGNASFYLFCCMMGWMGEESKK